MPVKFSLLLLAGLVGSALALTQIGLVGTPEVPSAHTLPSGQMAVSLSMHGHSDASLVKDGTFLLYTANRAEPDTLAINDLQAYSLSVNAVLGLANHLDLGFSLPWIGEITSDTRAKELSGQGLGDPILFFKAGLGGADPGVVDLAILGEMHFASASKKGFLVHDPGYVDFDTTVYSQHFHSAGGPWGAGSLLATLDFQRLENPLPFAIQLGAGYRVMPQFNRSQGPHVEGAMQWFATPNLGFFVSGSAKGRQTLVKGLGSLNAEWARISGGLNVKSDEGFALDIGLHRGLGQDRWARHSVPVADGTYRFATKAQPDWSLTVQFGWVFSAFDTDRDKDDIPDRVDACANAPEDKDDFQDTDGCPEPDNDMDSVSDINDECPLESEDIDGNVDEDGCPEPDNDKDSVLDTQDQCPQDAEDRDGYMDYDGCPDLDNDGDGLPDHKDKCLNEVEDTDGYQDQDGCPDPDNDGDGILDVKDACPNQPEKVNGYEDFDGCPDEKPTQGSTAARIESHFTLNRVHFQGITTEMLPESYAQLDSLVALLLASPKTSIEIQGYMDNQGGEAALRKVSQARADRVRAYLILKGVPGGQVIAQGMGSTKPIASNANARERLKNRRMEVVVLP